ncbi:MAG: FkbM family methyltransferase [Pseudomonadota bacterium]
MAKKHITFTNGAARRQYIILMMLFRLAFNRYLYGIFTRSLARFFSSDNAAFLKLPSGENFKVYLNDGYWTRFLLFGGSYEPEIADVIQAAAGKTNVFCDLGANTGFWTVYAANLFDKITAIEASSDTYQKLTENTRNLRNVSRRWAAVYSESNKELQFINTLNSHASSRLGNKPNKTDSVETVETVAIDDVLKPGETALIKLDVEGAEVDAIDGAKRALSEGSVIIYEDHGSDQSCKPSAHLLSMSNISLYSCENPPQKLENIDDVVALKQDRYRGYNFLAAHENSPLLTSILQGFAIH